MPDYTILLHLFYFRLFIDLLIYFISWWRMIRWRHHYRGQRIFFIGCQSWTWAWSWSWSWSYGILSSVLCSRVVSIIQIVPITVTVLPGADNTHRQRHSHSHKVLYGVHWISYFLFRSWFWLPWFFYRFSHHFHELWKFLLIKRKEKKEEYK